MLHPFQEAYRSKISRENAEACPPCWELLALLSGINEWLEGAYPCIQSSLQKQAVSVYILYRNVVYTPEGFWDLFGQVLAQIHEKWPICVYGTAENQETVRLTARAEEDAILLTQESISGKRAGMMNTLCIQVDCTDNRTAERVAALLTAMHWDTNVAALNNWQEADFLREQRLLLETEVPGFFCYAGVDPEVTAGAMLDSLDFRQKLMLWTVFLRDGFEPAEFSWMADNITRDTLEDRLEWELALWEAMDQLGFTVVNREKDFAVYDGAGRRLYFGADCRRPAERAFLKILFPLNY